MLIIKILGKRYKIFFFSQTNQQLKLLYQFLHKYYVPHSCDKNENLSLRIYIFLSITKIILIQYLNTDISTMNARQIIQGFAGFITKHLQFFFVSTVIFSKTIASSL